MEDLLGKAFARLNEARKCIERRSGEYADKYAWWAFVGLLILSAIFGGD